MKIKLNYRKIGAGDKTFVLLHHFGGNSESWHWVAQRLKRKYGVVLITLPGFGNTPALKKPSIYDFALYINDCIEEMKLANYLLCGHSMSAKLILYADQIATAYKTDGLILVAPSPPTIEKMEDDEKQRMLPRPTTESAKTSVDNATVKQLRKKRFQMAVQSQLQVDEKTWKWWLEDGMLDDISDRITGIETPTYVICAKDDPIIMMDDIYKEVLPNLHKPKLIQLGRCGHLIPLEAPRRLSRRLQKIASKI